MIITYSHYKMYLGLSKLSKRFLLAMMDNLIFCKVFVIQSFLEEINSVNYVQLFDFQEK